MQCVLFDSLPCTTLMYHLVSCAYDITKCHVDDFGNAVASTISQTPVWGWKTTMSLVWIPKDLHNRWFYHITILIWTNLCFKVRNHTSGSKIDLLNGLGNGSNRACEQLFVNASSRNSWEACDVRTFARERGFMNLPKAFIRVTRVNNTNAFKFLRPPLQCVRHLLFSQTYPWLECHILLQTSVTQPQPVMEICCPWIFDDTWSLR